MRRTVRPGFTLVEVLVVVSLLGILMGLSVGLIARVGAGEVITQTTNALSSQLASARASAFGSDTAYVAIVPAESGAVQMRVFRDRQVFHWACEDLESASEYDMLKPAGSVQVEAGGVPSREGRNVLFEDGGRVSLGNSPILQWRDGFMIRCRVRASEGGAARGMRLFKKGENLDIALVSSGAGTLDVRARIKLEAGPDGKGGGKVELTSGQRGRRTVVPEWQGPVIPGRWQDVQVSYDRSEFSIQVDGSVRAIRTDLSDRMEPELTSEFVIGGSYAGGFDSLLIAGIFEDDDDVYDVPEGVLWIDKDKKPVTAPLYIHFRNRGLDPRKHKTPLELRFQLDRDARPERVVDVALSGEVFVRRGDEQ